MKFFCSISLILGILSPHLAHSNTEEIHSFFRASLQARISYLTSQKEYFEDSKISNAEKSKTYAELSGYPDFNVTDWPTLTDNIGKYKDQYENLLKTLDSTVNFHPLKQALIDEASLIDAIPSKYRMTDQRAHLQYMAMRIKNLIDSENHVRSKCLKDKRSNRKFDLSKADASGYSEIIFLKRMEDLLMPEVDPLWPQMKNQMILGYTETGELTLYYSYVSKIFKKMEPDLDWIEEHLPLISDFETKNKQILRNAPLSIQTAFSVLLQFQDTIAENLAYKNRIKLILTDSTKLASKWTTDMMKAYEKPYPNLKGIEIIKKIVNEIVLFNNRFALRISHFIKDLEISTVEARDAISILESYLKEADRVVAPKKSRSRRLARRKKGSTLPQAVAEMQSAQSTLAETALPKTDEKTIVKNPPPSSTFLPINKESSLFNSQKEEDSRALLLSEKENPTEIQEFIPVESKGTPSPEVEQDPFVVDDDIKELIRIYCSHKNESCRKDPSVLALEDENKRSQNPTQKARTYFSGSRQRALLELFFDDSRNHLAMAYRDVQKLVKAVGGKIKQDGSSHCTVIVPNGISHSFIPHGASHSLKLSTRCIQGFRLAFENAGLTPDRLIPD